MGIDVSGKLFVGSHYNDICFDDDDMIESYDGDILGWADDMNLIHVSPYYDADPSECYFGYTLEQTEPTGCDYSRWCRDVQVLAERFEKLTGATAKIIGMQHVY